MKTSVLASGAFTLGCALSVPVCLAAQPYDEIVDRSLFVPSRRAAVESAPVPVQAAQAAELTLFGVLITGKRKLALLRETGSERDIRLEPGGTIGDWTLAEVNTDSVVLRNGARLRQLVIKRLQPMQ